MLLHIFVLLAAAAASEHGELGLMTWGYRLHAVTAPLSPSSDAVTSPLLSNSSRVYGLNPDVLATDGRIFWLQTDNSESEIFRIDSEAGTTQVLHLSIPVSVRHMRWNAATKTVLLLHGVYANDVFNLSLCRMQPDTGATTCGQTFNYNITWFYTGVACALDGSECSCIVQSSTPGHTLIRISDDSFSAANMTFEGQGYDVPSGLTWSGVAGDPLLFETGVGYSTSIRSNVSAYNLHELGHDGVAHKKATINCASLGPDGCELQEGFSYSVSHKLLAVLYGNFRRNIYHDRAAIVTLIDPTTWTDVSTVTFNAEANATVWQTLVGFRYP